ncbi:hypothetical protein JHK82_050414 [Glycine max]|nr:hypothetical protein JHK85_051050 [Glycine max]KAG5091636.1 hypothetical protein JHK82_050414 [Glycine max]
MEDLGELTLVQLAPLEQHDIEEFLKVEELECTTLAIEEKLWMSIDELLEENLDFWTKFSTFFFTGIQKFETTIKDLSIKITMALKASAEDDDFKFTSYQAAKFQDEVLNMNNLGSQILRKARDLQIPRTRFLSSHSSLVSKQRSKNNQSSPA